MENKKNNKEIRIISPKNTKERGMSGFTKKGNNNNDKK